MELLPLIALTFLSWQEAVVEEIDLLPLVLVQGD
jgi:hypothetical protein